MNIDLIDCIPLVGGFVILAAVGYVLKGGLVAAMNQYGLLIVLAIPCAIALILLGAITVIDYHKTSAPPVPQKKILGFIHYEKYNRDPIPTDGARSRDVAWGFVVGLVFLGLVGLVAGWWG